MNQQSPGIFHPETILKSRRSTLAPLMIILILSLPTLANAQRNLRNTSRNPVNLIKVEAQYLKSIFGFPYEYTDTVPGPDPLLIPRYKEDSLIRMIFNTVFQDRVQVYNPNFWGSIPQFLEIKEYKPFDTTAILNYLSAGWDTSLVIDEQGNYTTNVNYREIPFNEISGIFFFESWWMDARDYHLYKDVIAYLPIREYLASKYEGFETTEIRKRLLFMVIPEYSSGEQVRPGYRRNDFLLVKENIEYTVELYNKTYNLYLNRDDDYGQINHQEYFEWQYHQFDFYRYFDPDLLLEKLITAVIEGNLSASLPGKDSEMLSKTEFIALLQANPYSQRQETVSDEDYSPPNYPVNDLNSLVFTEDWYINPDNLQIYKDVKSVTVNRSEVRYDQYTGDFIQSTLVSLFTIRFD